MDSNALGDTVFAGSICSPLEDALGRSISLSDRICIVSSFVQISGAKALEPYLREAVSRGATIKLLTGKYLDITDPDALFYLRSICGNNIEIRFYSGTNSFHPKAYFTYSDAAGDSVFVGSSNISRSALTSGVEWNYRIDRKTHTSDFEAFEEMFGVLWTSHSYEATDEEILRYKNERIPRIRELVPSSYGKVEPNDVQILACSALERTREEGMDRGLVVAATGTGKTYLAAMDSKEFSSVLFVAHNKDILRQARKAFETVRPGISCGFCFGGIDESDADFVFATVQTLGKDDVLQSMDPERFEYIVIDEFHHAPSQSYRRILGHFRPKFLLGLTATPERMDCQEVFALCGNNVVYEIRLLEAIKRGFLCPFRYKGIADNVDYEKVRFVNGHYDVDELTLELSRESRADLVYRRFRQYAGRKVIGFCSSVKHADFMSDYFAGKGVRSCTVSSRSSARSSIEPEDVRRFFSDHDQSVLFVVDMFNEGVDIPEIDTVMFLRPTESMTVYIQQLGRGLRRCEGKTGLMVLDFIGNYRNADIFPRLMFNGRPKGPVDNHSFAGILPPECDVDYDLETIDLYRMMYERRTKAADRIADAFDEICDSLGHTPSRVEFYNYMPEEILIPFRTQIRSVFRDYLGFLSSRGRLDAQRTSFTEGDAGRFIRCLEQTSMSRMYKLPVFLSFIRDGKVCRFADFATIGRTMRQFYSGDNNSVEFAGDKDPLAHRSWTDREWIDLAVSNPVRFLCRTHPGVFRKDDEGLEILLDIDGCSEVTSFRREIEDIVEYRSLDFKDKRYTGLYNGRK